MTTPKKSILQKGRGKARKEAKYRYSYEKNSQYFAQVAHDIIEPAMAELKELGALELEPFFRGIRFKASKKVFYKITYFSRLLSRVLVPLCEFPCKDKDLLYKETRKIQWEEFLSPKKTFAVSANVSESEIDHSHFAGLRVKDAIADYFRDRTNRRPSVDAREPDLLINLHIQKNVATLSIDASSGPLHKRGYREETVSAPMQESVAAAIIRLSEWTGEKPLYDPMCGSGTLLCEALMAYSRVPAQIFRSSFGFKCLPDFDPDIWEAVRQESMTQIQPLPRGLISGSDISEHSVNAARTNLMGLHFGGQVNVAETDFRQIDTLSSHVIVANPPYGIRMGKELNLNKFYQDLGSFLKTRCSRSTAFIYFGEPKFIKKVPLAPTWKRVLNIGGLDGRLVRYDLH